MLFSHQYQIASKLSRFFDSTMVVTADSSLERAEVRGMKVLSSKWESGKKLRSIFRFFLIVLPHLLRYRKHLIVFSHMAEVQAMLIAPICRLLRIRHYLWYAHASSSFYLKVCHIFATAILTSTRGSCPLQSRKVRPLGQGVSTEGYENIESFPSFPPVRWYYVGRLDPSKKVDQAIVSLEFLKTEIPEITFDIYGGPSSAKYNWYLKSLQSIVSQKGRDKWIRLHGPVLNSQIPEIAEMHDAFIHMYSGSLDKVLIEACMAGRIIVTTNEEFLNLFYPGRYQMVSPQELIRQQFRVLMHAPKIERESELKQNLEHVREHYSLDSLVKRIVSELDK